jgi:hypothetical protein
MPKSKNFKEALGKIADSINQQRRQEVIKAFSSNTPLKQYVDEAKSKGLHRKPKGAANYRLVASMPESVDKFFTDVYGENYYKDPDFFKKFPEWATVAPSQQ